MSTNNKYWVLFLEGEEPEIFTSWTECEKRRDDVLKRERENHEYKKSLRPRTPGFRTKDEAEKFIAEKWSGNLISEEAKAWLEEYKAREEQLKQDTELDASALSPTFLKELPEYCAYVDGSYNEASETYGFGVVFICDGKIEKLYGSGKEKNLVGTRNSVGELLACMEAVKHAKALGLPEFTIIYDCENIWWAYYGRGDDMLTQAAGQYMYDLREEMEIKVESIEGWSHKNKSGRDSDPGNVLVDKLAKKGAGVKY